MDERKDKAFSEASGAEIPETADAVEKVEEAVSGDIRPDGNDKGNGDIRPDGNGKGNGDIRPDGNGVQRGDRQKNEKGEGVGGKIGLSALLILPFVLFCAAVSLFSVFFFREYVESSNVWRFIVNTNAVATPDGNDAEWTEEGEYIGGEMEDISIESVSKPDDGNVSSSEPDEEFGEQIYYDKRDIPGYKWGELWATLSIPSIGLESKNVYVGESNAIYKKGIGKRFGTRFPGQGGNIVLSAHVTREFYDLQEMEIGDRVYIETEYGSYVYEVYETLIFSVNDYEYVMNYDDGEKLTLYTCHPRGTAYRTERYGVLCKKLYGPEWIKVD